jgi:hypothetical protein
MGCNESSRNISIEKIALTGVKIAMDLEHGHRKTYQGRFG